MNSQERRKRRGDLAAQRELCSRQGAKCWELGKQKSKYR